MSRITQTKGDEALSVFLFLVLACCVMGMESCAESTARYQAAQQAQP